MLRWAEHISVHTHSKQAVLQLYFQTLRSYFKAIKKTKDAFLHTEERSICPLSGNTAIRDREGKIGFLLGKKRKLALMLAFFYKELSSDRQGLCTKT